MSLSKLFQKKHFLLCFFVFLFGVGIFTQAQADVPDRKINTDGTKQIHNEEQIWVSPVDSNVVMIVWRDFRLGYRRVGLGVSYDEGHTWIDSLLKGGLFTYYSDPAIYGDRLGNFYPLTMNYNGYGFSDFSLWKTTNNGASWAGPYYVLGEYADYLEDKEFMAIDRTGGTYDGNMYIAWARFPNPTRIMFVRSTTGGISWGDTLIIGDPQDFGGSDAGQFTFPFVDAYGNVYVIWRGHCYIPPDYYYCQQMVKSTDGGQTFSDPTTIFVNNAVSYAPGNIDIYNSVCMDADITNGPYRGNIYLTVPDGVQDGPYYHSDILFMKSTNGGNTWTQPLRVNDDPMGKPVYQFHQWITINQKGAIVILFYDQRNDPPNYRKFDTYVAFSFDGGETFTTNYRVSDVSSDPGFAFSEGKGIGHFEENKPFMSTYMPDLPTDTKAGLLGEYIGVVAYNDQIHCTWTDTRDSNQNVYYSNFKIPLLLPRLFLPVNGSNVLTLYPTFKWSACGYFGEITYDLEISTDSTFATIDFKYTDIDTNVFTVSKPLYPHVPTLLAPTDSSILSAYTPKFSWSNESIGSGVKYFWRVKAFRITDHSESEYSNVWSFNVDASASVFYSLEIISDTVHTEYYEYTHIYDTSFTIPDTLTDSALYYWRVKASISATVESGWQEHPFQFTAFRFKYGDPNGDGMINSADIVYLINYLFIGGPAPIPCLEAGDANCDGVINIADVVYLINHMFAGGPAPGC